jgi:predicted RNA-binding Zn ribbon-like protein
MMEPSMSASVRTETVADYQFDLDGGRPCLDFANTRDSSGEHLNSYSDLVAFAAQSTLLSPDDAAWLRAEGQRDGSAAEGVLERARRLRGSISAIFSALARGQTPPERDIDYLNFELSTGLPHACVLPSTQHGQVTYRWGWEGRNLDAPLWPISRSAADVLTSDADRELVRECGGSDCNWLFLDTSKNRTRQWCSMRSCGNREKARRHYERRRGREAQRNRLEDPT